MNKKKRQQAEFDKIFTSENLTKIRNSLRVKNEADTLKLEEIPTEIKNGDFNGVFDKLLAWRSENNEKKAKKIYRKALANVVDRVKRLHTTLYAAGKESMLCVFQGMDAGGKDGAIKRLFFRLDPHGVDVWNFKKPTRRELAHDFLWRVHRLCPPKGTMCAFNRSHYEDVVAVRARNLIPNADEIFWQKRLRAIREFEAHLVTEGTRIVKIFLHICKDEQKNRFKDRLNDKEKFWKFNPADLEDRKIWHIFQELYAKSIFASNRDFAPWFVIPADYKPLKDLLVACVVLAELEELNPQFPKADFDKDKISID